jgi:hypothetical protein
MWEHYPQDIIGLLLLLKMANCIEKSLLNGNSFWLGFIFTFHFVNSAARIVIFIFLLNTLRIKKP